MRRKLAASKPRGQRGGFNSHSAELLACCLGISNLRHLTDEDVRDLCEFIMYFIRQGYDDGFRAGYSEAQSYNCDLAWLRSTPQGKETYDH